MNVFKKHQRIIQKEAIKNPMQAYFLGGFHLLNDHKQEEVKKEIKKLIKLGENDNE